MSGSGEVSEYVEPKRQVQTPDDMVRWTKSEPTPPPGHCSALSAAQCEALKGELSHIAQLTCSMAR